MAQLFSLLAMVLWGVLLGFCCQFFLAVWAEKETPWPRAILPYVIGGALCFLATALFLYGINGGAWGLYGFLSMVLGFFLYRRKLWTKGEKLVTLISDFGASLRGGCSRLGAKATDIAVLPFGKIVDKGDQITQKAEERWEKRRQEEEQKVAAQAEALEEAESAKTAAETEEKSS